MKRFALVPLLALSFVSTAPECASAQDSNCSRQVAENLEQLRAVDEDPGVLAKLKAKVQDSLASAPKDHEALHRELFTFSPQVVQDKSSGRIYVDLKRIKDQLLPELARENIHPDEMLLEVDGGAEFKGRDVPVDMHLLDSQFPHLSYAGGPVNRQQFVRIVLKEKGREVHVTDNALIENQNFARIDARGYVGRPQAELQLPGLDTNLVSLSGKITDANKIPGINPSPKFRKLQKAFDLYGPDFHPLPLHNAKGNLSGWQVELPPHSGKIEHFPAEAIEERVDAAFSQHGFDWDSKFGAEALADSDPKTALNTLVAWLDRQDKDGWFYREADYKGMPYHRLRNVKFGKMSINRETFNPPLTGFAWDEVYRYNPSATAPYLDRASAFMKKQMQWLRDPKNGIAEYDSNGKLVGFRHTNLGSGEDNAPIPLDEFGLDSLPKYGITSKAAPGREKAGLSVALLSQYLQTLKTVQKFAKIEGKFAEASSYDHEIGELTELLRTKYRNPTTGWYENLVPVGQHDWERVHIETLGGFWAVAAGVAKPDEIQSLVDRYLLNPKKFGGPALTSVPRDNPYFKLEGGYWRGGIWPPQLRMVSRALQDNGLRAQAAYFDEHHLKALNLASQADRDGDTPAFFIQYLKNKWPPEGVPSGKTYDERRVEILAEYKKYESALEEAKKKGIRLNPEPPSEGTLHEFLGIHVDSQGNEIPGYGVEIRGDGTLHQTRRHFAGWGMVVPKTIARSTIRDAVPAFQGPAKLADRWLYENLTDPGLYLRNQVRTNPAFKPLTEYLAKNPHATYGDFQAQLQRASTPELREQIEKFRKGYVEISPVVDPAEGKTVLRNYTYDGKKYDLSIERLPDGSVKITVTGPPMQVQFNPSWDKTGQASEIFEIGGTHPTVILRNGKVLAERWPREEFSFIIGQCDSYSSSYSRSLY